MPRLEVEDLAVICVLLVDKLKAGSWVQVSKLPHPGLDDMNVVFDFIQDGGVRQANECLFPSPSTLPMISTSVCGIPFSYRCW